MSKQRDELASLMGDDERKSCDAIVWDGPYRVRCGYVLVNDQCVRHDVPFGRFASQRQTEVGNA